MGRLPPDLEEKRQRLVRAARRGAFENYVRKGSIPEVYSRIALAADEAKNLDADVSLRSAPETSRLPSGRPTAHYTWRTAGDDKVRGTHAAQHGRVFSWANPPEHGHPGQEVNCRCWPEPYYGDPAVPDSLLQMVPERRVSTDPGMLWASVETLTRPDGSIAASVVVMNDGTAINSKFVGSTVEHVVTLQDAPSVRFGKAGDTRSVSVSREDDPPLRLAWMARALSSLPPPALDLPRSEPAAVSRLPGEDPRLATLVSPASVLVRAALALYGLLQQAPASLGAGTGDVPIVVHRVWQSQAGAAPVLITESLTREQVTQMCPRAGEVQTIIDLAAAQWAPLSSSTPKSVLGTWIHHTAKKMFDEAQFLNPAAYANMYAEVSIDLQDTLDPATIGVTYGMKGSTRLDVLELVNANSGCVYDYKTGQSGLAPGRIAKIFEVWNRRFPGVPFIILEMRQQMPVWSE